MCLWHINHDQKGVLLAAKAATAAHAKISICRGEFLVVGSTVSGRMEIDMQEF